MPIYFNLYIEKRREVERQGEDGGPIFAV